ncbi:hypothetical protein C8R45DRAFT_619402 [Mycena sanguinolenta]|nr:hypothetical protein C8R45DRAFT_619402 [Mycena sanguinolenta]
MGLEQRRKQLMANQVHWGDQWVDSPSPPQLSKHVDFGGSSSQSSSSSARDSRDTSPSIVARDEDSLSVDDAHNLVPDDSIMMGRQERRKPEPVDTQAILTCKNWTLESLIQTSNNFYHVPRVKWSQTKSVAAQIKNHDTKNPGVPLVVEGLHKHPRWLKDEFTPEWFQDNGPEVISVRNVHDRTDKDIPFADFMARTRATSQFKKPGEKERLYGKDVACPPRWHQFLETGGVLPPYLAPDAPGNALNNLPKTHRPETLMCYVGVGDTFTPAHKDLCASSGHNLMCYTENGGSSFWFMTATSSANAAAEYFQHKLNQVLDHEAHTITVEELAEAPFKVYITEQKLGDLVLVPPRSMHQVVNSGGMTFKTSWSRMTLDGLSLALRYELPLYRRVCRSEVYRVKATIYHTLLQKTEAVSNLLCAQPDSPKAGADPSQTDMPAHLDTLRRALLLFDSILVEEYSPEYSQMRQLAKPEGKDEEIEQLTCDFCGGDIFLSFFECRSCVNGSRQAQPGAGFSVCPGCYVEGRTCACEVMSPMQCRFAEKLFQSRARAVDLFNALHASHETDLPLNEAIRTDDRVGLFRAGIMLRKRRLAAKNQDDMRRCTVRSNSNYNHDAPTAWILQCTKCHAGSCLAHMVWKSYLHSAEALLACGEKDGGEALHAAHLASGPRYQSEIANLKREAPDYIPDLKVQLAYLATTFTTCRPVAANSKWKSGHYDSKAWEICLPQRPMAKPMLAKARKNATSRPASKPVKRFFLDYVLIPPPPVKRKNREFGPVPTARSIRTDQDDDTPLRKKLKSTHPSRGPLGVPSSSKRPAVRPSRTKSIISVSDTSDSEDERPQKRPRITSRTSKHFADIRLQQNAPQPAISVADAFNTASAQNSKSIPNTVRQSHPSVSVPAPILPRRKVKSKAAPVPEAGPSSSPEASSSRDAIQDQIAELTERLSGLQAQFNAGSREERRGRASEAIPDSAAANERRSFKAKQKVSRGSSSERVNPGIQNQINEISEQVSLLAAEVRGRKDQTMLGLMTELVRMVASHAQPPPIQPSNVGFSSANWPAPYRGRSHGRGGSVTFSDHPHRSMPFPRERDFLDRPVRTHRMKPHFPYRNAPFPPASARYNQQTFTQRIWTEGPHAHERHEESGRFHSYAEDERRESQEPPRRRRPTRFSPPNSSAHGLDVVLAHPRPIRPLAGRALESPQSDGSVTVTNAPDTSGSNQPFQPETPARAGTAAKFFRSLTGASPTSDDQDWETTYENTEKTT